jgi:uncharacterized RDD family membrane protein YckC
VSGTTVSVFPEGAADRQGTRAGTISRLGAMVIDLVYSAALLAAVYLGVASFRFLRSARTFAWPQPAFDEVLLAGAVVVVLMLTVTWSSTGRTSGMKVMGLRVIDPSGGTPGPVRSFLRAVACVAFPLGLFWSAFSRRNASVQDLLFGTSVIYDWRMHVPAAHTDERAGGADPA